MEANELISDFARIREKEAEARKKQAQEMEDAKNGNAIKFDPFPVNESFDPSAIERRDWLSVGLLLRQHITLLISPGGVGKSTLSMLIAVAVALGRSNMVPNRTVAKPGNVLVVNSEEDLDEMQRRLAGILKHYKIEPAELTGKLHIESLYGRGGLLAHHDGNGDVSDGELIEKLVGFCRDNEIRLIVIDPLVGFHDIPENDNTGMEKVATVLRRVARGTGAAVLTVHHTRKSQGSESHAGDMDAGRGASALAAAARIAITLARMTKDTATKLNIDWKIAQHLRRIDDAKQNYAPAVEEVSWFEMADTQIANGERVGVPVEFDMAGIAERAAIEKQREIEEGQLIQRTKTARVIVGDKVEGSKQQPEAIDHYEQVVGVKRTAAQEHVRKLPLGKENAFQFSTENHRRLEIWRNQVGTENRPRYTIAWAEYSEVRT
jgi:RecA-family ATPase